MQIDGIKGMGFKDIEREVERGGRFVIYTWVVSVILMSFKRPSPVIFVRGGESRTAHGLRYVGLTALVGWWGVPWGVIWSLAAIIGNLCGGTDITTEVMADLEAKAERLERARDAAAARAGA